MSDLEPSVPDRPIVESKRTVLAKCIKDTLNDEGFCLTDDDAPDDSTGASDSSMPHKISRGKLRHVIREFKRRILKRKAEEEETAAETKKIALEVSPSNSNSALSDDDEQNTDRVSLDTDDLGTFQKSPASNSEEIDTNKSELEHVTENNVPKENDNDKARKHDDQSTLPESEIQDDQSVRTLANNEIPAEQLRNFSRETEETENINPAASKDAVDSVEETRFVNDGSDICTSTNTHNEEINQVSVISSEKETERELSDSGMYSHMEIEEEVLQNTEHLREAGVELRGATAATRDNEIPVTIDGKDEITKENGDVTNNARRGQKEVTLHLMDATSMENNHSGLVSIDGSAASRISDCENQLVPTDTPVERNTAEGIVEAIGDESNGFAKQSTDTVVANNSEKEFHQEIEKGLPNNTCGFTEQSKDAECSDTTSTIRQNEEPLAVESQDAMTEENENVPMASVDNTKNRQSHESANVFTNDKVPNEKTVAPNTTISRDETEPVAEDSACDISKEIEGVDYRNVVDSIGKSKTTTSAIGSFMEFQEITAVVISHNSDDSEGMRPKAVRSNNLSSLSNDTTDDNVIIPRSVTIGNRRISAECQSQRAVFTETLATRNDSEDSDVVIESSEITIISDPIECTVQDFQTENNVICDNETRNDVENVVNDDTNTAESQNYPVLSIPERRGSTGLLSTMPAHLDIDSSVVRTNTTSVRTTLTQVMNILGTQTPNVATSLNVSSASSRTHVPVILSMPSLDPDESQSVESSTSGKAPDDISCTGNESSINKPMPVVSNDTRKLAESSGDTSHTKSDDDSADSDEERPVLRIRTDIFADDDADMEFPGVTPPMVSRSEVDLAMENITRNLSRDDTVEYPPEFFRVPDKIPSFKGGIPPSSRFLTTGPFVDPKELPALPAHLRSAQIAFSSYLRNVSSPFISSTNPPTTSSSSQGISAPVNLTGTTAASNTLPVTTPVQGNRSGTTAAPNTLPVTAPVQGNRSETTAASNTLPVTTPVQGNRSETTAAPNTLPVTASVPGNRSETTAAPNTLPVTTPVQGNRSGTTAAPNTLPVTTPVQGNRSGTTAAPNTLPVTTPVQGNRSGTTAAPNTLPVTTPVQGNRSETTAAPNTLPVITHIFAVPNPPPPSRTITSGGSMSDQTTQVATTAGMAPIPVQPPVTASTGSHSTPTVTSAVTLSPPGTNTTSQSQQATTSTGGEGSGASQNQADCDLQRDLAAMINNSIMHMEANLQKLKNLAASCANATDTQDQVKVLVAAKDTAFNLYETIDASEMGLKMKYKDLQFHPKAQRLPLSRAEEFTIEELADYFEVLVEASLLSRRPNISEKLRGVLVVFVTRILRVLGYFMCDGKDTHKSDQMFSNATYVIMSKPHLVQKFSPSNLSFHLLTFWQCIRGSTRGPSYKQGALMDHVNLGPKGFLERVEKFKLSYERSVAQQAIMIQPAIGANTESSQPVAGPSGVQSQVRLLLQKQLAQQQQHHSEQVRRQDLVERVQNHQRESQPQILNQNLNQQPQPTYIPGTSIRVLPTPQSTRTVRSPPSMTQHMAYVQQQKEQQRQLQRTTQNLQQNQNAPQNLQQQNQHVPQNLQQNQNVPQNLQQNQHVPQNLQQNQHVPQNLQQNQHVPQNLQQNQHVPQNLQQNQHGPQNLQQQQNQHGPQNLQQQQNQHAARNLQQQQNQYAQQPNQHSLQLPQQQYQYSESQLQQRLQYFQQEQQQQPQTSNLQRGGHFGAVTPRAQYGFSSSQQVNRNSQPNVNTQGQELQQQMFAQPSQRYPPQRQATHPSQVQQNQQQLQQLQNISVESQSMPPPGNVMLVRRVTNPAGFPNPQQQQQNSMELPRSAVHQALRQRTSTISAPIQHPSNVSSAQQQYIVRQQHQLNYQQQQSVRSVPQVVSAATQHQQHSLPHNTATMHQMNQQSVSARPALVTGHHQQQRVSPRPTSAVIHNQQQRISPRPIPTVQQQRSSPHAPVSSHHQQQQMTTANRTNSVDEDCMIVDERSTAQSSRPSSEQPQTIVLSYRDMKIGETPYYGSTAVTGASNNGVGIQRNTSGRLQNSVSPVQATARSSSNSGPSSMNLGGSLNTITSTNSAPQQRNIDQALSNRSVQLSNNPQSQQQVNRHQQTLVGQHPQQPVTTAIHNSVSQMDANVRANQTRTVATYDGVSSPPYLLAEQNAARCPGVVQISDGPVITSVSSIAGVASRQSPGASRSGHRQSPDLSYGQAQANTVYFPDADGNSISAQYVTPQQQQQYSQHRRTSENSGTSTRGGTNNGSISFAHINYNSDQR